MEARTREAVPMICGTATGGGACAARVWGEWWQGDPEDACRWPDELLWCCFNAAGNGPLACTCWQPRYSAAQADCAVPPGCVVERAQQCADCAYRADSPEQSDTYMAEKLDDITFDAHQPFWCHQGIRWPVAWVHPAGYEVRGDHADYSPPIIDGRPYKADGSPADLCVGWAARNRHHLDNVVVH